MDVKYKAVSISVFFFAITMSGTFASIIVGTMIQDYDSNITDLSYIMVLNTALPCLLASICFFKAGTPYSKQKTEMEAAKESALDKASEMGLEMLPDFTMRTIPERGPS